VLARMGFAKPHQAKLHSTDALERLNKDVKRRADVVGTSPNEGAIIQPIGVGSFPKPWCSNGVAEQG
jgi:putative transposase